ncbi:MAG: hypothetical protein WAO10_06355 [Candidatus Sulfotelmatobacter sp.]
MHSLKAGAVPGMSYRPRTVFHHKFVHHSRPTAKAICANGNTYLSFTRMFIHL